MAVDGSLEGLQVAGDEVEEGRLAGPVLSDDGDTRVHAERVRGQPLSPRTSANDETHSIPKERSL